MCKSIYNERGEKLCWKCDEFKQVEDYYFDKKHNRPYAYCKRCQNNWTKQKQADFKQACINYCGGKCSACGYSRCSAALEFHHIDPTKKDFTISNVREQYLKEEILRELDKCVVVCANCHREIHSGIISCPDIDLSLRVYVSQVKTDKEPPDTTIRLRKPKREPKGIARKVKNRPSKEELAKLIEEHGYRGTGKLFGVTDNAVRKWLKAA